MPFSIFSALKVFKILANSDDFETWLTKNHPLKNRAQFFIGYKFAMNSCLNQFVSSIEANDSLGFEHDFLFDRARSELVPIDKLENTCEKTIFLKNIKPYIKGVARAKTYEDLKFNAKKFNEEISSIFDTIFIDHIHIIQDATLSKARTQEISIINFTHTFLTQIGADGPYSNFRNMLSVNWSGEEYLSRSFEGYKYVLQYLWNRILGDEEYCKSSLINLHTADTWKTYNYIPTEKTSDFPILDKYFNLEEQKCLDSYFHRVRNEITNPLGEKLAVMPYLIDRYLEFDTTNYNKLKLFGHLLKKDYLPNPYEGLSIEDKIMNRLYWYHCEIVDSRSSSLHFGVSSFNTMLAGTVALHNPEESEFEKIIVSKFTHPVDKIGERNDYSYGILIDTKSAAGHYSSGWVIYLDVCGDHSGFSGGEFEAAEKLIKQYRKQDKIELRELTASMIDFTAFTDKYLNTNEEQRITEQNKLIPQIIQQAKGYAFELFTYYLHMEFFGKIFSVKLNVDQNNSLGEKDIVLLNDKEVIIIECKLNVKNQNVKDLIENLEKKLDKYPQKIKSAQIWFWENNSEKNTERINKRKIKTVFVKERTEPMLKNLDLSRLEFIMQDYSHSYLDDIKDIFANLNVIEDSDKAV